MEIPVFLFTGFLGSGKTTFIQDTLENEEFGRDGETLLLICEQGDIEYDKTKFSGLPVSTIYIESEDQLSRTTLTSLTHGLKYDRVMVEYNGMWENQKLFANMPAGWAIAQEMTFFDSTTFTMFNQNMRQLCFNKMQTADMIVFNRFTKGADKMSFHKEARIANRNAMIIYESGPNDIEVDDIVDPLPYNLESEQIIELDDAWYAEWYADLNENPDKYHGKRFRVRGRAAMTDQLPRGQFAFGRHVMTCCIEDTKFAGLLVYYDGDKPGLGDWILLEAEVRLEFAETYGEEGPVLYAEQIQACAPCEPEIATF